MRGGRNRAVEDELQIRYPVCMGVCRIFSKFLDEVIKNEIVVDFEFPVLHFIACPVKFFIFVFAKVG